MNTAPFIKVRETTHAQQQQSDDRTTLGLPQNSLYGIILGKLFKLHPDFDEALFSILLQSQSSSPTTSPSSLSPSLASSSSTWYLLFIAEKNSHMNRVLYLRWREKQREICCMNHWNPLQTSPCCEFLSYCEMTFARLENTTLTTEDQELLARRCQNYVLHRLRFVHYHHYTKALFSTTVALDTFPYGGELIFFCASISTS
jgi:hypothetical protein